MTSVAVEGLGHRGRARLGALGIGAFVLALAATAVSPMGAAALFVLTLGAAVAVRVRADCAALATGYLVAVVIVPSRFTLPVFGGLATPANAMAVGFVFLWILMRLMPGAASPTSPGRVAVLILVWASAVAMCVALQRPLLPLESRSATKGLIQIIGLGGIALYIGDGIRNRVRFDAVVRRLTAMLVVVAALGVVAFFTGFDLASKISIPGMTSEPVPPIEFRSSFRRVDSTMEHPIEFGLVMAMGLPFAIHHMRFSTGKTKRRWLWGTALIAVAIPMSVSRTTVLALAIGTLALVPSWPRAFKRQALKGALVFGVVMKLMVPGLLGTLRSIVLNAGSDPSVTGRTIDYDYAGRYFFQSPLFGRGLNTFEPTLYDFLDNQFIKSSIEGGFVLLGALVVLFGAAALGTRRIRRDAPDERTKDLSQVLLASTLMMVGGFATFDLISFDTAIGLLFVLVGLTMALRRVVIDERLASLGGGTELGRTRHGWVTDPQTHASAGGGGSSNAGRRSR